MYLSLRQYYNRKVRIIYHFGQRTRRITRSQGDIMVRVMRIFSHDFFEFLLKNLQLLLSLLPLTINNICLSSLIIKEIRYWQRRGIRCITNINTLPMKRRLSGREKWDSLMESNILRSKSIVSGWMITFVPFLIGQ